jgi:FtsH-binding integral membrane protein
VSSDGSDARTIDTEGYVSVHERAQTTLVARTFIWLTVGLVLSGAVAAWVGLNDDLYERFVDNTVLFWVAILSPIAIIVALGWLMDRISVAAAASLFVLFSFLEGLSLSFVFQAYTTTTVVQVFFIAAGMFAVAGVVGFVTKRDLTRLGGILFLGLIGVLGGTIVNIFWASDALYWVTTYAGVAVFLGLTVYDFNILKKQSEMPLDSEAQSKASLWLAIGLYLNFVNLMLFLLRIFGRD